MYPVSKPFLRRVKQSHQICVKCEVFAGNEFLQTLKIYDGSISMEYQAERQRRFTAYLGDPEGRLTPDNLNDLLAVTGNEIKLSRGVVHLDGTEEFVPLGVFPIGTTDITDGGDGHTIRLEGFDRSKKVSDNKWIEPYVIPAGTLYTDAIRTLILDRYPQAEIVSHGAETFTTPQIIFDVRRDPWLAAMSLAKDIGCDLYFDGNGVVHCDPIEDCASRPPLVEYVDNEESVVLSINKRWRSEALINYWIVTGESADDAPPVSASAFDDDPQSPTYIYGKYGIKLQRYQSNTIRTEDQALTVANSLLALSLGSYEELHFNSIVNPAHEPGDVITLVRERLGISSRYVLDKITIPMTSQRAMEVRTRQR